jgi:hypothetical protein
MRAVALFRNSIRMEAYVPAFWAGMVIRAAMPAAAGTPIAWLGCCDWLGRRARIVCFQLMAPSIGYQREAEQVKEREQ